MWRAAWLIHPKEALCSPPESSLSSLMLDQMAHQILGNQWQIHTVWFLRASALRTFEG